MIIRLLMLFCSVAMASAQVLPFPGPGSAGSLNPKIRGAYVQNESGSPITLTWPSGTITGDLVLIAIGNENNIANPSGWSVNFNAGGVANMSGAVFSKTMTSGDITTGSVNIAPNGGFPGTVAVIAFVGGTAGIRETDASAPGNGSTSRGITTTSAVLNTDTAVYFGSTRANVTASVNKGTQVGAVSGNGTSGVLATGAVSASGAFTATFSYSSAGSGDFQAVVIVKGV